MYKIYKGLQKPLTFKFFKGKYIYWGVGVVFISLIISGICISVISMWVGLIVLIAMLLGGFYFISTKQKKGLYNKTKHIGIFHMQAIDYRMKNYEKKSKKDI